MYLCGGEDSVAVISSELWIFDPSAGGSWTNKSPVGAFARARAGMVAGNGKLYVFGGDGEGAAFRRNDLGWRVQNFGWSVDIGEV